MANNRWFNVSARKGSVITAHPADSPLRVEMRLLDEHLRANPDLWPTQATPGAAAYDLRACLDEPLTLAPGQVTALHTGVAVHINDPEICGLIAPRSGLGTKGIVLANIIGIIDSDYMGELLASVWNYSTKAHIIQPYERVFQLLFLPVRHPELQIVTEFSNTSIRGQDGFGSTGSA